MDKISKIMKVKIIKTILRLENNMKLVNNGSIHLIWLVICWNMKIRMIINTNKIKNYWAIKKNILNSIIHQKERMIILWTKIKMNFKLQIVLWIIKLK